MEKIKVSASVVSYNGYEEICKTVNTVIDFTKQVKLQLYLVDNASPDATGKKLQETNFGDTVQVICLPENIGFGKGHNTILPLLESKYHAVINPDILLDTDAIGVLCGWMEEHPEVVMVTPRLRFLDGSEQYTPKRRPTFLALLARQVHFFKNVEKHYLMQDEDLTKEQEIDFCTGCFFIMRTDVFRKMGGFDEDYFMYVEDADITRKAQQYGKVMYVPHAYVYHAWHRDTHKKWSHFWMQIKSMFLYWKKWGFRFL